ncbi:MAG: hypothetical protein QOJ59_2835 [Thermomicrobiales bacterium]|jgi:RNA polymerase sigma-70 factor (ECF subfamily)|nr:hypothetical protein [Thermomicrobiales bacterium]
MSLVSSLGPSTVPVNAAPRQEAFAALYDTYFDPIYWYCRGRLGTAQEAEDATSLVFANALAAGPRYGDPSLRSWLFSIAHNVVINTRRANRSARAMAPLEAARDITDDAPLPEQVAITQDERYRLLAALDQLPEDQRHVVQLRMAGLTGLEVAALMGRSHPAVKMLQQRAFVRLRELLAATAGDEERIRYG